MFSEPFLERRSKVPRLASRAAYRRLGAQTRFNANDVRKNIEAFPTSLRFRTIKRINKHVRKLGQYLRLHRSSDRKRRSSCLPLAPRRTLKIGNEGIQRLRGFERNLSVKGTLFLNRGIGHRDINSFLVMRWAQ